MPEPQLILLVLGLTILGIAGIHMYDQKVRAADGEVKASGFDVPAAKLWNPSAGLLR
jgi:hypothetical protein